ncbi:MAG TPA: FAD-binding oxidoreductase [Terracidiphilus sp.]|nr:FAD-binding oxidoreductase [Terracidiphilus sp.]
MIDRRPSAIVRPASIDEVMRTVRYARDEGVAVTVRGGGHNVAGKAVTDGAMMIDLSRMDGVQVDARKRTALVQGGSKWGVFDAACEPYQLATTGGVISTTGVTGLTLGGGLGWLMGKHGLSCDNVLSADLVSAEGSHMRASAEENPELFWAIRGGGGNFGIVTALEFQLHELSSVHGGVMLYPRANAMDLLRHYRDITASAPDELTAYAALLVGHGHPMAAIALCYSGPQQEGPRAIQQFQLSHAPVVDMTGEKKYSEVQSMLDFTAPSGARYYFKCPFVTELSDEVLRLIVDYAEKMPTEQTQIILEHMHGAASRVPAGEAAFGLRRVQYSVNIIPAWTSPAMDSECMAWAKGLASLLEDFGTRDAYVNYLGEEGASAVKASYGSNFERLARIKRQYDPDNFFCFNQNIPPGS